MTTYRKKQYNIILISICTFHKQHCIEADIQHRVLESSFGMCLFTYTSQSSFLTDSVAATVNKAMTSIGSHC